MSTTNVATFSEDQLYDFVFANLGSNDQEIAEILKNNAITGEQFLELDDSEVKELFKKVGHRKKVQKLLKSCKLQTMAMTTSGDFHSPKTSDQSQLATSTASIHPKVTSAPPLPFISRNASTLKRRKIAKNVSKQLCDKSQEVAAGPPAVYKLEPRLRNIDDKRKIASYAMKFGKSGTVDALHKVLMVVGGTGTGKSTMINALANHILGVTFSDPYRYQLISQAGEGDRSQTQSQTSWVKAYTFPKQPGSWMPYTLTIIDTPGYGDTEGIDRDLSITQQIKYFFESKEMGVDHINAIAFIVKASDVRLTATQRYIFKEILKVFGKDVEPGIMTIATHADGAKNQAEDALKEAGVPVQEQPKFLVNNSALFESNVKMNSGPDDSLHNSFVDQSEMVWNRNEREFVRMGVAIGEMKSISLWLSIENLRERESLFAVLESIGPKIKECINRAKNMKATSATIKEHERSMEESKDFTTAKGKETVAEKVMVELEDDQKSLNCQTCETTCLFPYTTKYKRWCQAISFWGNKCKMCPEKCPSASHTVNTFKYDMIMRYVEKKKSASDSLEELKEYKHVHSKLSASRSKQSLSEMKIEQQKSLIRCEMHVREAKGYIDCIREISLNPSPTTEEDYINLLIANEQSEMEDGWKDRIASLEELKEISELVRTIDRLDEDNGVDLLQKFGTERPSRKP